MEWKPNRNSHFSLHEQIVDWMKEQIEQGIWIEGTKLLPQRKLAEQLGVNRSTIIQAIEELKADGLLETIQGAGTFVSNNPWKVLFKKIQPNWNRHIETSIHKANYYTIQLINEYEQYSHIIRLGTGELSPDLLPTEKIQQSLQSLFLQPRDIGYSEPKGSKRLRESISSYLQKRNIYTKPENILIVSGALQALQLISVGLLEHQSIIFHEHPSYLNSVHPFQSAGMQLVSVESNEQLVSNLKKFKRNKQALFYAIPTLHNPTGKNMTTKERQQLLAACLELQIPIIEDDVYHELLFDENYPAMKSIDQNGQVLYLGSVSKTLSPGLRIGWVVGPELVINRLADIKMQTDYGSSAISQEIVAYWLSNGLYEEHIKLLRSNLLERACFVLNILKNDFYHVATWEIPEGGFYIWLKFHEPIVNKAFFLYLLDKQVLINPGYIYDPNDQYHIRLSYAYASKDELKVGLCELLNAVLQFVDY